MKSGFWTSKKNKVQNPDFILTHFEGLVLLNQTTDCSKVGVILVAHFMGYKNHLLNTLVNAAVVE